MSSYYLGIDVSKGYSDFIMLNAFKHPIGKTFQLDDTARGHKKLEQYLREFYAQYPDAMVYSAVESTGGYENNWYRRLVKLSESYGLQVARLNPAWVKFNSEASAKHNKTDAASAKDIAEYLISHPEKVDYRITDTRFPKLRQQWTAMQLFIKQHTQLANLLDKALYSAMPEMLSFCRHKKPLWLLQFLQAYPTYDAIAKTPPKQMAKVIPYLSLKKARALQQILQHGIGHSDALSGQNIAQLATMMLMLNQQIKESKKRLVRNYEEAKEQVELLRSCKGIGVYSAIGLLMNIPAIENFINAKKLASYWGLHPVYRQSGDSVWTWRMSKKGRAEPRAILYMVARTASRHNPLIKEVYGRAMAKGMVSKAALGVCMHKLARIIYGMLKNQTPFDPEIDRANQDRFQNTKNHNSTQPKNRHLQEYDPSAPTSNQQNKKRKQQALSQGEPVAKCGIDEPAASLSQASGTS